MESQGCLLHNVDERRLIDDSGIYMLSYQLHATLSCKEPGSLNEYALYIPLPFSDMLTIHGRDP